MKKLPSSVIFLFTVLGVYALVALLSPPLFNIALTNFLKMAKSVFPILAFVFLVLVVINLLGTDRISRHLGEGSGVKGLIYTLAASAVISMPPYLLYPVLENLKKKGMKTTFIASFLYNRNVQIAFVPAMVYYFGLKFTIIFGFYVIIFSILSGLLTERLMGKVS